MLVEWVLGVLQLNNEYANKNSSFGIAVGYFVFNFKKQWRILFSWHDDESAITKKITKMDLGFSLRGWSGMVSNWCYIAVTPTAMFQ